MKIISEEHIVTSAERLYELEEEGINQLLNEFSDSQPELFNFILSWAPEFGDEGDFQCLLELSIIAWDSYRLEFGDLPPVSREVIETKINQDYSEGMEPSGESGESGLILDISETAIGNINQPVLLEYLADEIQYMIEDEELVDVEEASVMIFSALLIMVDALQESLSQKGLKVV